MTCKHKPNINFSDFLCFWNYNSYNKRYKLCKICNRQIKLAPIGSFFIILSFLIYLLSGLLYLILYGAWDKNVTLILVLGGVLFHILKFVIQKYGPYKDDS